jgi:anaerobic ribonucleoside-triphosphate reductase/predicted transcriptional regulator
VDSDKNYILLEKQLKTLGQKIRIDILKKLKDLQVPFSFSKLQKEVLEHNLSSVNFSFHLNALKKCELIDSSEDGYSITTLGKEILNKILSIEQILANRSKIRMIRTSKYSKELFDSSKIEEYLVTEGELDIFLAKQITRKVEKRLTKTNIEYLTAPLMREYINAILLENGLEEVRHKLTRLGTPPYEVFKLFNSKDTQITPEKFIERLGSDVSEQFLLLNLLPKNLADMYLSGEIALLHLNHWSLRPLSVYLNTNSILKYIYNKNASISANFDDDKNVLLTISDLCNFFYKFKQFYSGDLVLGDFNNYFIANLDLSEDKSYIMDLLTSQILRFEESCRDNYQHLSLGFNSKKPSHNNNILKRNSVKQFLSSLMEKSENTKSPNLLFNYSDFIDKGSSESLIKDLSSHTLKNSIILENYLLNSATVKIPNPKHNKIILDKILLNLHMVSIDANQNDDVFFELLQDKIESVFEFFQIKKNLVKRKLSTVSEWNKIIPHLFEDNSGNILNESIKSISFFGLNKAILNHCGIELDRTESSTSFALNVLTFVRKLIEEKNESENDFYTLTQPHNDKYLSDCFYNEIPNHGKPVNFYSSKIIRDTSSLTLIKKISLFKKFEAVINGGSIFDQVINANDISLNKYLKMLIDSKINAFSLGNFGNGAIL